MTERLVRDGDPLWLGEDVDPHAGFSVELIERLATVKEREPWASPWLFSTTELYSFGRCYREVSGWPRWLPIPVYGDHGVVFRTALAPHEEDTVARVHLTFNARRAVRNVDRYDRRVVLVRNPWVDHRRSHAITPCPDRRGTLFIASHTVPGLGRQELEPDATDRLLGGTGPRPLVVMLHRHDVTNGLHRELISAGIPVVTAGNTTSPLFIDRFYALATVFEGVLTDTAGSHVAYCHELGLPVTIIERRFVRRVRDADLSEKARAIRAMGGAPSPTDEVAEYERRFASAFGPDGDPTEQDALVAEVLGLDSDIHGPQLRRLFWCQLFIVALPATRNHGMRMLRQVLRRLREQLRHALGPLRA